MGIDQIIDRAKSDTYYHKDTFVKEIVDEYYDDALVEAEGDPEEAAAIAVENFYRDMAYGRASNLWKSYTFNKPEELLSDPKVQEFDFDKLDQIPRSIKEALVLVVGAMTFDALWRDLYELERAVLEAVRS